MTGSSPRCRDCLLLRALKAHPTINLIAAVALVIVIVIVRQSLLATPQLFAGGAAVGEVLFGLSMALLAAWIFNLVVVVIPRLRAERLLLAQEYRHLRRASGAASAPLREMSQSAGNPLSYPLPPLTLAQVKTICENVDTRGTLPAITVFRAGVPTPGTWQDYLVLEADRAAQAHQRIEAAYAFLPVELVAMLRGLTTHHYVVQIDSLKIAPIANEDLGFLAPTLYDYMQKCSELGDYLEKKVEPILP